VSELRRGRCSLPPPPPLDRCASTFRCGGLVGGVLVVLHLEAVKTVVEASSSERAFVGTGKLCRSAPGGVGECASELVAALRKFCYTCVWGGGGWKDARAPHSLLHVVAVKRYLAGELVDEERRRRHRSYRRQRRHRGAHESGHAGQHANSGSNAAAAAAAAAVVVVVVVVGGFIVVGGTVKR